MSSGVVDEAIDSPGLLHRRVDQVLDVGLARHVALHEVANAGSWSGKIKAIEKMEDGGRWGVA